MSDTTNRELTTNEPEAPPPATVRALPAAVPAGAVKNPWVAAGLAVLFPGLGHVYLGLVRRALLFFGAFVCAIWGAIEIDPMPFAFLIPFTYLFNVIDSFRAASRRDLQAPEPEEPESPAWGIGLILLGVLFLANNLGWLRLEAVRQYWPLLLIVAGALVLRRSLQGRGGADGNSAGLSL